LRRYEAKLEQFDIDIYLPHYSALAIPTEDLKEMITSVRGMKTVKPEALLILKQSAEIDRRNTVKGMKDAIDILALLAFSGINLKKYAELLKKYKKEHYLRELLHVLGNFSYKDIKYLDMDFMQFKEWKRKIMSEIKALL